MPRCVDYFKLIIPQIEALSSPQRHIELKRPETDLGIIYIHHLLTIEVKGRYQFYRMAALQDIIDRRVASYFKCREVPFQIRYGAKVIVMTMRKEGIQGNLVLL